MLDPLLTAKAAGIDELLDSRQHLGGGLGQQGPALAVQPGRAAILLDQHLQGRLQLLRWLHHAPDVAVPVGGPLLVELCLPHGVLAAAGVEVAQLLLVLSKVDEDDLAQVLHKAS